MRIFAINAPEPEHLVEVLEDMKRLGAPTIKAVWMEVWATYVALEGSHRLAAAKQLGLTPIIDEVEYDEHVLLTDIGCDDGGYGHTIAKHCALAWDTPASLTYTFDEDDEGE